MATKLGLTMTEATLIGWLKREGGWVETGETLFVLEMEGHDDGMGPSPRMRR
jgi:pyruvate/2-oxoglutarate dehydrogenase complex dihydrolipoamide acyltransferase (E2) component